MNKFNGIEQKKTERKTQDWLNATEEQIENFYTSYVMRYTKDSIEDILRDYNTLQIETNSEIVDHFGNFFKPNK